MTARPTISVALASYNGARYLAAQLDSLASQTRPPDELVICDDASTDATMDIAAAFAARVPFPVRIERNPAQLGYRVNFMKAASLCRSDIIAFCDQDDVWLPHKLQACRDAYTDPDILMVYHNATVVTEGLAPIGTLSRQQGAPQAVNPPRSIEPWHFGLGFTQTFRRELLTFAAHWPHSVDFYNASRREAHDQWFFFLASSLGTIRYIAEPLVQYRQHGSNLFGWHGAPVRLQDKWRDLMSTDMLVFSSRMKSAARRTGILVAMEKELEGERKQRAALAAAGYRELEAVYRDRLAIYNATNVLDRLGGLLASLRRGGYRAKIKWGVGHEALVRDIVRGVVVPAKKKRAAARGS
jgi:glycosyltransferase involved in cell wall biosynthesis